jgi:hypothetical protein
VEHTVEFAIRGLRHDDVTRREPSHGA